MARYAVFLFLAALSIQSGKSEEPSPKAIVFQHVTVIDGTGIAAQLDRDVVVRGDRIAEIAKAGTATIPKDAELINGSDKFLIPGLWDMHVHIASQSYLPLFIANGVTGVREMHAFFPDTILQMREDVSKGKLLGPRIVAAGAIIDGEKPFWPGSVTATNAEHGRQAVQSLKKRGADFIKVYSKLSREAYFAIADEARKQELIFAGHVPETVSVSEASDAGQKSLEHLYGVFLACSSEEAKLRKEESDALEKMENSEFRALMIRTQVKALDSYSEDKARVLFAHLAKNGTWQVPTLTVLRAVASLDDERFSNDSRIKYMPAYIRSMWKPGLPPEILANLKLVYRQSIQIIPAMHRAGIPFLAGTDTTNPYCFPGFSLHDELALLVEECRFTPLEALQCATLNPAKFLGREKDLGTIERGKLADLVLLDANPLDNIKNTQKIAAVMANGKLKSKSELEKMLNEAAAAAGGK
jgi:imidazolonepropionase-like amidohydrolase